MKDEWKTLFYIEDFYDSALPDDPYGTSRWQYFLFNSHTHEKVGTYKDRKYAIRQARYKYKKLAKLIERKFTSLA